MLLFFPRALSLVLPSRIMYSCSSRLYPFYCLSCGAVIPSPLDSAVSRLTSFISVMCWFILNMKTGPGLCTPTQNQFSVEILVNLDLSSSQHYSCTNVTFPRDLNESGKANSYKRVNFLNFFLYFFFKSKVQGCWGALTSVSGEPSALECGVALLPLSTSFCRKFNIYFIPRGVYPQSRAYFSEKHAKIKYSLNSYLQFCVAPEKAHVLVQFDCNSAMTCVSESDSQAFCLFRKCGELVFWFFFFWESGKNWYSK